jgi:hypothetical protein
MVKIIVFCVVVAEVEVAGFTKIVVSATLFGITSWNIIILIFTTERASVLIFYG